MVVFPVASSPCPLASRYISGDPGATGALESRRGVYCCTTIYASLRYGLLHTLGFASCLCAAMLVCFGTLVLRPSVIEEDVQSLGESYTLYSSSLSFTLPRSETQERRSRSV